MGRVDGLIIPRSYNDYFSRSDPQAIRDLVAASTDDALSSTSENPVQNKVVKAALDGKQATLTFDNAPTENSNNPVKSGGVYAAIDTYRSGNYYNSVTATNKYCKIATISTNSFSGTHDATMQVRIRLFETTYGVPYTADVTMAIRASGATVIYSECVCHETYLGSGSPYFNANILKYTREVSGNVHTLNLYIYFTNNYRRISVEVLSTSQGDVGSIFSRGGGSIPMAISDEMSGLEREISFSSMLPFAPTIDGTYALQCDVSSGLPAYSWGINPPWINTEIISGANNSIKYRKIGNFVYLHVESQGGTLKFNSSNSAMVKSDNTEVILPSAIIPETFVSIAMIDNSYDTIFHGRLLTNGKIQGWNNSIKDITTINSWQFDVCYFTSSSGNRSPETKGGEDNGNKEQPTEELKK